MKCRPTLRAPRDRGSGSVLALALVAALVIVTVAAVSLAGALAERRRVISASQLAALAAADAASGAIGGAPCTLATRVVAGGGARLTECVIDGLVVDVTAEGSFAGIPISARSRAGPP